MKHRLHLLVMISLVVSTISTSTAPDHDELIRSLLDELQSSRTDAILYWNSVALQACSNDFDPLVISSPDQPGPTATSRAFAIIHGAMYDAMVAFNQPFRPIFKMSSLPDTRNIHAEAATDAAIMEAAYQTLNAMYPKQRTTFEAVRRDYLRQLKTNGTRQDGITRGIVIGRLIAAFVLSTRENDGSERTTKQTSAKLPGSHQVDPMHPNQGFVGVNWGNVAPFLLLNGSQFRPLNTVGDTLSSRRRFLNSTQYATDFREVKAIGAKNSFVRTRDQTEIGIFWAYDGVPKLGPSPRLYNQIVRVIAMQQRNTVVQNAHLFALANYAMADVGIAAWDCKYYYNLWRPIVGIRQPYDGYQADRFWVPMGAPASNGGSDFTPGFPGYVSGHASFGCAVFEVLRCFYRTDNIGFRFQSDEFNGRTIDSNTGQPRKSRTRFYRTLSEAETENYVSRIYLGVHFRFDQLHGKILGRKVGRYVFDRLD